MIVCFVLDVENALELEAVSSVPLCGRYIFDFVYVGSMWWRLKVICSSFERLSN